MQNFFDLPQDVKLKYKKGPFDDDYNSFWGFTEPGEEL